MDHNVFDGGPATRFAGCCTPRLCSLRKQTHPKMRLGTDAVHLLRVAEASFSVDGPQLTTKQLLLRLQSLPSSAS